MHQTVIDLKSPGKEIDVLFVFGDAQHAYSSLRSWLKKESGKFLVFVEDREELFLQAKELPIAKDPQVRVFYWKRGEEEIFSHAAWEFVFLRFGYAAPDPERKQLAQEFFAYMEHYRRGVNLLASDSEDMGLRVLKNAIDNLPLFSQSRLGTALEGKCSGLPAIVCGAGPSLNMAAPLLAQAKDKALIIAGGTAALALGAHGITPDICAHVDPEPPYQRFLQQDCFEVPFFYQGRFCHCLLEKVQAPLLWMPDSGNFPLEGWIAAEAGVFAEHFDAGWTAANFCTAIAAHLGCRTVIFVGMDFSCRRDAIYASGIAGEENREELIELEEKGLYSKPDWLMSAEWTGAFAKKHPNVQWINATEGGIDLAGIGRKKLSDVLASLEVQRDISATVHLLAAEAPRFPASLEKGNEIKEKLEKSFEKCLEICEQMLKVWEKHYPNSPLEKGEYAILDMEMEQEICHRYFLAPLWNVWKRPILRSSFHPLGQHVHRLLFLKQALEKHIKSI